MKIKKINLSEKFASFTEHWSPKIVGDLNGQQVKIAKFKGEFVRHHHENEDEFFMVINGLLYIELDDETLELNPGEFVVIPKGVYHKPYAHIETEVMLFEPVTTLNTGEIKTERTVENPDRLID